MTTPADLLAFATGEVSPSLFGRIDVQKERLAGSTIRNMTVSYRGGLNSRAGTKFCGFSGQTGTSIPPRLIPFQFSTDQGLALEFFERSMRVLADGGYIVESLVPITGITQANPGVVSFSAQGAATATPVNTNVTFSYAPNDTITLAGGTPITEAELRVLSSQLVSILSNAHGTGYAAGDTVTLGGGTAGTAAIVTVGSTLAYAATGFISFTTNPSDGDTITLNAVPWTFKTTVTGAAQTKIQATLAATMAQLASDLNASANASLTVATYGSTANTVTVNYDTTGTGGNAYTLAASAGSPSAATLTGGTTNGIASLGVTTAGAYSALPVGGAMTQSATSGGGTGASFQTAVFGPNTVSIINAGAYGTVPPNPVQQDTTSGIGVGAEFLMTWNSVTPFANGDWVVPSGILGMTELNGNSYVLEAVTATTAQLFDVFGNAVDTTGFPAYTGGGELARIYTLATPYAAADLPYLKYTQSADTMTLCCVNQITGTEYPPQDLVRITDTDWSFSDVVAMASVDPPATTSATINGGSSTAFYQWVVTAISPVDGTESIASPIAAVSGGNIALAAGQATVTWSAVPAVNAYNIYKAQPSYGTPVPVGALFGYIGSAYGGQFLDTNIVPDYTQVPPRHQDPFARGQVVGGSIISGGSGYTTATAAVNSVTGSGAVLEVVVESNAVSAIIVVDPGEDYVEGDSITISGAGTGATAQLVLGAESGTYPSVPAYFQERRVFGNSLNAPDTYWMSQVGAFRNFDGRIPTIDSDAITGSPWAVQVNGIQFFVQTAGGLLVMTGLQAWLLVGAGSFATNVQPISPSSQDANPQPFTGCSTTVPPIKVNYDVLYVTAKGSYYYDLPYQLYALSEPVDLTQYSSHLFTGHTILQHAWCEQPYKTLWAVRDDGILLCLTYLKAEQLAGWTRSDTNGLFCSVCTVSEPPVDALYVVVQRYINGRPAYMVERMDDRFWSQVEDVWAVDAGLSLAQPMPAATLSASSATGTGAISGATIAAGGTGYSAGTTVSIVDNNGSGPGTGAAATPVIAGGVITGLTFSSGGTGYTNPRLVIEDPTGAGSGASAVALLDTSATFTASASIFANSDVGSVIRMGGGIATITAFTDTEHVTATITQPIVQVIPNSTMVLPQPAGSWTLTKPVSTVTGLGHLAGATVTGLADGNVVTPRIVQADGSVILDAPASAVVLGLGYQAQFQSVYLEGGDAPQLAQRKTVPAVNALLELSRGVKMGANQLDGSTLSPSQIAPAWSNMKAVPDFVPGQSPPKAYNDPVTPLYTGFRRIPVINGQGKPGQIALQQDEPLPLSILALVPDVLFGDTPQQQFPQQQRQQ